jgi:hypothetical protein
MAEPCSSVRDLVPELALGVAAGDERAFALKHLATCAECRAALEETTGVVDELVLLAPEHEPPPGFEGRVLAAIDAESPRRRRAVPWLVAAAVAVLVAVGATTVTRWADADDRRLADQYRQTLDVADGSYLRAADLVTASGDAAGHVFAYQGQPSWVFMTVEGVPTGNYDVTLMTEDGRIHDIGTCWVRDGRASWGTAIDVPVSTVDRLEMRAADDTVVTASLASTSRS